MRKTGAPPAGNALSAAVRERDMPRKLPPLNAVRAFEVAGRYVSFTRAAAELHVTHGAVSRQVALLEQWLGTPLFKRLRSQLSLTDAGRAYLAEVTAVLDRLALASMDLGRGAEGATLSVNAPPTFTMRWLIPRISSFQHRHPGAEIGFSTSIAPVNFQENSYGVAIRGANAPLAGCLSQPFMSEFIVPVCHADLCERGRLRAPGDLASQTLISYSTEPYAWSEWLDAAGVPKLRAAGTLKFEQMYFALQAACEGLGVVLVPMFLAIDDVIAGRLQVPFGLLAAKKRRYYANALQASPLVSAFFAWLDTEGQATERAMNDWIRDAGW
jgi:LysR family glycine cleavage system transcriptional activator